MKPFIKWVGNKYRLVPIILDHLSPGKRLVEPFAGSGALFLNSSFPQGLLNDSNPHLISMFLLLQRCGPAFIDYCKVFFEPETNTERFYYDSRAAFNDLGKNAPLFEFTRKAALFLYLNRHGYNGLCRYNKKGEFNTPFGNYVKPYFPEKEMVYFYEKAATATFTCADFRHTFSQLEEGDVVYADPPYLPLSPTANFTQYGADGFGVQDHSDLAALAEEAAARGIPVVVSNHDTPLTREIYGNGQITEILVQRNISCVGSSRKKVKEVLMRF